jgi:4-amino-4-deoxy-L-arabinose transferase-like glycosyltransferase
MRFVTGFIGLFLVLGIIVSTQIGLSVDAAHYALYGKYLAWSYYDHPPLVGWLQAIFLLFGSHDFLMRLWPLALSVATAGSLYYIAPRLMPTARPYFAEACVVTYYTAPILFLLGIDLLPQTPLLLLSLWISYFLFKISQEPRWKHWLGLGLLLGLAGLAEYTAILLALGTLLYLLFFQRRQLLSIKPYMAALVAFICVLPVFYWNWQHQWISFYYQLHHGFAQQWSWITWLQSLAIQFFVYGPGLFIFGLLGMRYWKDVGSRILICLALPILLMFIHSGGYERILPHWPAVGWLLLIPLAVRYVLGYWQRLWVKVLSGIAIILAAFAYCVALMQVLFGFIHFPADKNPLNDLYGWPQAAHYAKQLGGNLYVNNWTLASRLAWYSGLPVQVANAAGFYQYTLWYGKPNAQSNGILVVPTGFNLPAETSTASGEFANCKRVGMMPVVVKGDTINLFYFYRCEGFNT